MVSVVAVVLLGAGCGEPPTPSVPTSTTPPIAARNSSEPPECATCHEREETLWRGFTINWRCNRRTHSTVLGDFNRASFDNNGVTSSFFRNGSSFMVRTDGPDGALHDYEIKFTFGVYPLQQYLIAMPGGRLQALGIAWDSRPRRAWRPAVVLSISRRENHGARYSPLDRYRSNWNYMCADCHSTNLRKNYNAATRTFSTSYSEIDVSCEACHGPGSDHLAWAKKQGEWEKFDATEGLTIALDERKGVAWTIDLATGNARRSSPRTSEREIEMCARCHARRGEIHEDYVHGQPVGDDYRVALLDEDHYFPDGQIRRRTTNTVRSLRARCSTPVSLAAIVTSRTV